ncbi:hypothetical protein [Vibrio sp. 11-4(1)]|uniref:hypothetical protein n=1 Tax=Vibrio sp. 11-4(1) TaxID=2591018 RepID=UPI001481FB15|nr:hypothetical protein [Vibrio sp. 11-4(1)]NNN82166.1 hypothetical protein [Vibrio sp. 11-4(1)]
MIYTPDNTSKVGNPVSVFDGNGNEIKHVIMADTWTEEVTTIEVNTIGEPLLENDKLKTITMRYPGMTVSNILTKGAEQDE